MVLQMNQKDQKIERSVSVMMTRLTVNTSYSYSSFNGFGCFSGSGFYGCFEKVNTVNMNKSR
jgi:hypothetical protein